MRYHRSHLIFDGLAAAALTLSSFGIFYCLVAAQTDALAPLEPVNDAQVLPPPPDGSLEPAPLPPPPPPPEGTIEPAPLPPPPPPPSDDLSVTPVQPISPQAPPSVLVPPGASVCGNAVCERLKGESETTCPADCRGAPIAAPLPPLCKMRGIADPDKCKDLMRSMLEGVGAPAPATGSTGSRVALLPAGDAMLPKPCVDQGITDPASCKDLMMRNFPRKEGGADAPQYVPKECFDAGITDVEKCKELLTRSAVLPRCKAAGAATPEECRALVSADSLPRECRDKGVFDEEGCRALVADAFLPKRCKDDGVTDADACRAMLLEQAGPPKECAGLDPAECWKLLEAGKIDPGEAVRLKGAVAGDMPDACKELGAKDLVACERIARSRYVAPECRDAGIFTADACDRHLFESARAASTAVSAADLCGDAAGDPEKCSGLIEQRHFPKECLDKGITDASSCRDLLRETRMPPECRDAGASTAGECETLLRSRYMDPVCAAQGITDAAACDEFVYGRIGAGVVCEGLDADQCALAAKGRHLGEIMAAQRKGEEIGMIMGKAAGKDGGLDLDVLASRTDAASRKAEEMVPVRGGRRRLRVLRSAAAVAVTGDDAVESSSPVVLTFDSDGDGVPDDVERRLGTDPANPDSDGDGVGDLEELRKKPASAFAPVDLALLGEGEVGQPKTQGEVVGGLTVGSESAPAAAAAGLRLAGRAPKGTRAVSLYVYSDMPILVTTDVDADGQWSYTLDDQLAEGSHEVYVAINDETGRVVKKGNPLALLVSAAVAATTANPEAPAPAPAPEVTAAPETAAPPAPSAAADSQANASRGSAQQTDVRLFLVGGAVLLVAAASLAALLLRRRKNDGNPGPESPGGP